MRANDFVRYFKISHAKDVISVCGNNEKVVLNDDGLGRIVIVIEDLKRIIESHELVGNFGGIKRAKRILKKSYTQFNTMVSVVWNDKPFQCAIERLEQAIADVESCQ